MSPAAKTRLEPGYNSIDRVKPRKLGPKKWQMRWRLRHWDGKITAHTTTAESVADVKAKARAKADELLNSTPTDRGAWRKGSDMSDYLDTDVRERIKASESVKDRTRKRYLVALDDLVHLTRGYPIADATRIRNLEDTLRRVAKETPGSVSTARTVLSTWTIDALVRAEIIDANPIRGMRLDIGTPTPRRADERRTLTKSEWDTAIKHLLARDTTPLIHETTTPNRKSTYLRHERTVAMTILQAVTGLRISEANLIQWKHISKVEGVMWVKVPASVAKGRKGREKTRHTPILREDVADWLEARRRCEDDYVIGSPISTEKPWHASNADDLVPELYKSVADETGVNILRDLRSHSWRATLHVVYADTFDLHTRARFFGHTDQVAIEHYTDNENIEGLSRLIKAS